VPAAGGDRPDAPGAGRGLLHRLQKRIAHLRKQLRMLVAVDEIRLASEQLLERRQLHHQFAVDHLDIEPPHSLRAAAAERQKHAAIGRPEMDRQRRERAVSVACRPIAQRGLLAATSCRAATSSRPIAAPTTITDVALRRPRPIRSRMARLTPSAIP